MLIRRLFLSVVVSLCCFQTASAQQACAGVDNVLRTLSIVRDIQADTKNRRYPENIAALKNEMSRISLPALQPAPYREAFVAEGQALFLHISKMREAIASSEAGYDDYAKDILSQAAPETLTQSVQSLERFWACQTGDFQGSPFAAAETGSLFKDKGALPASDTKNGAPSVPTVGESKSGKAAPARALATSVSNGPSLDIPGNPLIFLLMTLSVIAVVYGIRRYSNRSRARAARHLIHKTTRCKVGTRYFEMIVVDITQQGLKLKHDGIIQKERKLGIELDNKWYPCRIKWNNHFYAGAEFKRTMNAKTFETVISESTGEAPKIP